MEAFLEKIIANDDLHARWLNTLSYLEYVGARKIFKSQHEDDIDEDLLVHMAEEIQHACFLKKLLRQNFNRSQAKFSEHDMLAKTAAKKYLQSIDAHCARYARDPYHAYLLTSYVIETRALKLYSAYEKVLREHNLFRVASILKQEEQHLHDMQAMLVEKSENFSTEAEDLIAFEMSNYDEFFSALCASIAIS